MDVRMPDGTIIQNVPDGTTQEQLQAQLNAHRDATSPAAALLATGQKAALSRDYTKMSDAEFQPFVDYVLSGAHDPITSAQFPDPENPDTKLTPRQRFLLSNAIERKGNAQVIGGMLAGATRLFSGPGQLATAAFEAAGVPGPSVADYNKSVQNMENMIVTPSPEADVGKQAGQLTAGALIPVGAGSTAKTLLGGIWDAAKTGAVVTTALGANPQDTTPGQVATTAGTNAAIGGTVGATLGAAPAFVPAAKNAVARLVGGDKAVAEAAANMAERAKSPLFAGMPTSLSEATGSPALAALEAKLAGKRTFDFQNAKLTQFDKNVKTLADTVQGSADPRVAATKLSTAFGKATAQMQGAASDEFGRGLATAYKAAQAAPVGDNVPVSNFKAALEGLSESVSGAGPRSTWYRWLDPEAVKANPQIEEALSVIKQAEAGGQNGLDAASLIRVKMAANSLRQGINKASMSPADAARNRIGKAIGQAVDKDIAAFMGSGQQVVAPGQSTATREALQLYSDANARYKVRLDQLKAQKNSFAGQAFKKVPQSPADAMDQLLKSSPEDQLRAINILHSSDPGALADMKAWKLQQVSQAMGDQVRAGNLAAVDPGEFIKQLTNGRKIIGERLWSPEELQHIKSGIAASRLLLTSMPAGVARSAAGAADLGRMAASGVTQSPAFVTMQLYNLIGGRQIEKILTNPDSVKLIIDLAKNPAQTFTKPTAATIRAIAALQANATRPDDTIPEDQP